MENSKKFTLNSIDWKKIGRWAIVAVLGAVATYLMDTIPNLDFGQFTPVIVALNSILVNSIRKFITWLK